jgi:hypothetical protein
MSPEEESEFFTFGCASRCIIKLCEISGSPISADDFVDTYRNLFPENNLGLLSVDQICYIVKDQKLCSHVDAFRDSRLILKRFQDTTQTTASKVLILSDRDDLGDYLFHCRLVLAGAIHLLGDPNMPMKIDCFHLFDPMNDGTDRTYSISLPDLGPQLPHFLVLRPRNPNGEQDVGHQRAPRVSPL